MIASLSGIVSDKQDEKVIIDVSGVGYGVFVSNEDYSKLAKGQETKLQIYEHVREQAHDLYGFILRDSQTLFERLLDVNGVGPKMALSLLSIGSLANMVDAISSGDVTYIQQASGVGKRVAERIVIELRDKLGQSMDLNASDLLTSTTDEALQALTALGFSTQDAAKALKSVDPKLPTEKRVKEALKSTS